MSQSDPLRTFVAGVMILGDMRLTGPCIAAAALAIVGCDVARQEQVWSTACPPVFEAILYPDGTFVEARDGKGKWRIEGNAIHLQVLERPSLHFISAYPELMSHDGDGILPFIDERTVEAELEGLKKRFYRCS